MPSLWLLLLLVGCPRPDVESNTDTSSHTDTSSDTDTAATDTAADTGTDTAADTGTTFTPDSNCDYIDVQAYVLECASQWTQVLRFIDVDSDPSCPDYYTVGLGAYLDIADAYAAGQCDDSCVYLPFQAVMFLNCDVRGEYTVYAPGGPGQTSSDEACPNIEYYDGIAGSGWYGSLEDYKTENPCP